MNFRTFGRTGQKLSEVGLGTWQLGGSWGDVPEADALETLRAAADTGVNFFDTADVYGDGRSERLIGRFLKESSRTIFIATKLGRSSRPGWPENFTRAAVRQHAEASLQRLGVEALDLIQLHCVPLTVLKGGEIFGWLDELEQEGKIKAYGASVESMEEALVCAAQPGLVSLQIIFNIFRQKPIHTLFQVAKAKNLALIVRLPLASGLLGGKMTKQTTFDPTDHRVTNREGQQFNVGETFAGLPFEKAVDLVDALKPFVPVGQSMADFALRWCLDFEAVSAVIPGARNPEQAHANARASSFPPLSKELHAQLADFYIRQVAANIRGPN